MNFENLRNAISAFSPCNEQEQTDKEVMLKMMDCYGEETLNRTCSAHFTTSVFLFNKDRTKVLMCWHLIDKSWSWLGGHADGDADMKNVILKEIAEESGVTPDNIHLLNDGDIAALTILAIPGHVKRGKYVASHLHMDCAFAATILDENVSLITKPDENNGLKWIPMSELSEVVEDTWKMQYAFSKFFKYQK